MDLEAPTLEQANFGNLGVRLIATLVAWRFFDEILTLLQKGMPPSSDHAIVDGTLIDA